MRWWFHRYILISKLIKLYTLNMQHFLYVSSVQFSCSVMSDSANYTSINGFSSVIPFCLSILFTGFSRQEYWSGLRFPSPVDVLSELSAMTFLSWEALHSMVHSFIELDKLNAVMWSNWLLFCDWGCHSVCPLREKAKRLMEAFWRERLTEGETGPCSDGRGHVQ